jgi:hypothetical protein
VCAHHLMIQSDRFPHTSLIEEITCTTTLEKYFTYLWLILKGPSNQIRLHESVTRGLALLRAIVGIYLQNFIDF